MKFNHKFDYPKRSTVAWTHISLECEQNRRENQVGRERDGWLTKDGIGFPIRMRNEETVTETPNYHLKYNTEGKLVFTLNIHYIGML